MTALAANRGQKENRYNFRQYTLKAGTIAFLNGAAFLDPKTDIVEPASSKTGMIYIGLFAEKVDASAAAALVNVDMLDEVSTRRFANDAANPVAATDVGQIAYFVDDQTVSIVGSGRTIAGRIWDVDPTKGVAIEKLSSARSAVRSQPAATTPAAYVGNDLVITSVEQDAVYAVPATGAASTVTLPAAALDGTSASFVADGTANAHTVQYRDATGVVNLTAALTAAKRHLVIVEKVGGKWFANAYVSP
jgi:hypothetical protein